MTKKYTPAIFQPTVRPSWAGVLSYISDTEKATILEAIIKYPNETNIQSQFWSETVKPDLEEQYQKFIDTCSLRGRGAKTYWGEHKLSLCNTYDEHKVILLKDKDKNKVKDKHPTVEEIKTYCLERKNNVDAEKFFDYYTSNGWKVGKNPMKDWRACVRTWERKETPQTNQQSDEEFYRQYFENRRKNNEV